MSRKLALKCTLRPALSPLQRLKTQGASTLNGRTCLCSWSNYWRQFFSFAAIVIGWWRNSSSLMHLRNWPLYRSCTDAAAPDTTANLETTSIYRHCDGAWRSAESCTDASGPNAKAKLDKSITIHDGVSSEITVSGIKATAPDAKPKLANSMNCYNADA